MSPLSSNDIEAELSYAYLHAVASMARVACQVTGRHKDNAGVDAQLTSWGPFDTRAILTEVDLNVQLKATIQAPNETDQHFAYNLVGIQRYNDLRSDTLSTPRILVVLFLPQSAPDWLTQSDEALSLHRCAYWVSLQGAEPSQNSTSQTVYLPKSQRFDVPGLQALMTNLSIRNMPTYQGFTP